MPTIEEVVAAVEDWRGRSIQIDALSGGLTNTNYPVASSGGSGSGSVTTVRSVYSSDSINRRLYDNTVFKPNDTFDIKWPIVNNGTKTLRAGLDLKYSSGSKLMPNTVVELPELKPGAEYKVSFDGVAPSKEGTYIMIYTVEGGLCFPYTAIIVEK